MRKVTLNENGELVKVLACGKEDLLDYGAIGNNQFIEDVGAEYYQKSKKSDYSNEIFIQYFVKKMEWQQVLQHTDKLIKSFSDSIEANIWNGLVESIEAPTSVSKSWLFNIFSYLKLVFWFFITVAGLIVQVFRKPRLRLHENESVAIVRSNATFTKLNSIKDRFSITLLCEDVVYRNNKLPSMLSYIHFTDIIKRVPYLVLSIYKDYQGLNNELVVFFNTKTTQLILNRYIARVVLKCCYEQLLYCLLTKSSVERFYTGNKEDRFAMVEKKIAARQSLPITCIPHGLEYSYRFPTGVVGDIFYCTSEASKACLTRLYRDTQFLFDAEIQSEIYQLVADSLETKPEKIVFFTESRDIEVNRRIISDLQYLGLEFSIRLHPKDSKANYLDNSLIFESDYTSAITNKICIARKSTVLVEALYNSSISISYLIDSKDGYYASYVFPSLNDKTIFTCNEKQALLHLLKNYIRVGNV